MASTIIDDTVITDDSIKRKIIELKRLLQCIVNPKLNDFKSKVYMENFGGHEINFSIHMNQHRLDSAGEMLHDIEMLISSSFHYQYESDRIILDLKQLMVEAQKVSLEEENHFGKLATKREEKNDVIHDIFWADFPTSDEEEKSIDFSDNDEDIITDRQKSSGDSDNDNEIIKDYKHKGSSLLQEEKSLFIEEKNLQEEQAAVLENELREMASQLKEAMTNMNTTLQKQNAEITELQTQTSMNLDKVTNVTTETKNQVKSRTKFMSRAKKWINFVMVCLTFFSMIMFMGRVPKRKNRCVFWCNNGSDDKSSSFSWNWKKKDNAVRDSNGVRYGGKRRGKAQWSAKRYEDEPHNGEDFESIQSWKESCAQCEKTDSSGKCERIYFDCAASKVQLNHESTKQSNLAKENRRNKNRRKSDSLSSADQSKYAVWWDESSSEPKSQPRHKHENGSGDSSKKKKKINEIITNENNQRKEKKEHIKEYTKVVEEPDVDKSLNGKWKPVYNGDVNVEGIHEKDGFENNVAGLDASVKYGDVAIVPEEENVKHIGSKDISGTTMEEGKDKEYPHCYVAVEELKKRHNEEWGDSNLKQISNSRPPEPVEAQWVRLMNDAKKTKWT